MATEPDDSDETEGRALYRAKADALANAQVNYAKRGVKLSSIGESKMTEPMLQFFAYEHLPPHLQAVSKSFGALANQMVTDLPRNPERTVALRKLLEAKDCAVRALLFQDQTGDPGRPVPQHGSGP